MLSKEFVHSSVLRPYNVNQLQAGHSDGLLVPPSASLWHQNQIHLPVYIEHGVWSRLSRETHLCRRRNHMIRVAEKA